jgi:hypothetical protein
MTRPTEHDPANTELIRRFFDWAYRNNLRPSIEAIRSDEEHGPRFRISVMWGNRELPWAFPDAEAPGMVQAFATVLRRFDPALPPFDPEETA